VNRKYKLITSSVDEYYKPGGKYHTKHARLVKAGEHVEENVFRLLAYMSTENMVTRPKVTALKMADFVYAYFHEKRVDLATGKERCDLFSFCF
jgi:hypothetical protein